MSDLAIAAIKQPSFVPDTAIIHGGAPKITLLNPQANEADPTTLEQPAFAATLKGYMKDLGAAQLSFDIDPNAAVEKTPSIIDGVKTYVSGVNAQINDSDRQTRDLLSGKTKDTGKVVAAVEESDLALDMLLAVTKRLTATYQTIESITI